MNGVVRFFLFLLIVSAGAWGTWFLRDLAELMAKLEPAETPTAGKRLAPRMASIGLAPMPILRREPAAVPTARPEASFEAPPLARASSGTLNMETAAPSLATVAGTGAIRLADEYLAAHKANWRMREVHQLRPTEYHSPVGTEVVYRVMQDGIPILDQEVRLFVGNDGQVAERNVRYEPFNTAEMGASISPESARTALKERGGLSADVAGIAERVFVPNGSDVELAYAIALNVDPNTGLNQRSPTHALVRASDGEILRYSYGRRW